MLQINCIKLYHKSYKLLYRNVLIIQRELYVWNITSKHNIHSSLWLKHEILMIRHHAKMFWLNGGKSFRSERRTNYHLCVSVCMCLCLWLPEWLCVPFREWQWQLLVAWTINLTVNWQFCYTLVIRPTNAITTAGRVLHISHIMKVLIMNQQNGN
jgi:hypothetical protein